jgi:hypothetical protein
VLSLVAALSGSSVVYQLDEQPRALLALVEHEPQE